MRLLLFGFLGYLLYRLVRSLFFSGHTIEHSQNNSPVDEMVQDPMCRTYIPLRDAHRRIIDGKEWYFCSDECASRFKEEKSG